VGAALLGVGARLLSLMEYAPVPVTFAVAVLGALPEIVGTTFFANLAALSAACALPGKTLTKQAVGLVVFRGQPLGLQQCAQSIYVRTYVHVRIYTYARTYVRTNARTYVRTYKSTHARTSVRTHLPTYLPTYLDT
jgi:hypothetical protein